MTHMTFRTFMTFKVRKGKAIGRHCEGDSVHFGLKHCYVGRSNLLDERSNYGLSFSTTIKLLLCHSLVRSVILFSPLSTLTCKDP